MMDSWGEVTLGRSSVSDVIMSNMYSAGGRTSMEGLRGGELCTFPAVGAGAMTLRPADEIMQLSCVPRIADHQLVNRF